MAVDGVYNNSGYTPPASHRQAPSSSSLEMDDFMQLLAMQLQNQDMNSPMSNSEMMGQLTSMATVQSMNTFSELSSTQYALNLIGQEVKITDIDDLTNEMKMISGTVSGINLSNMTIFLKDNSKGYGLGNVMEVGAIKEAPENVLDTDGDGKPDAPDVDGDGKPDAPEKPDDPGNDGDGKPDKPGDGAGGDGPGGDDGAGDKNEKSALRSRVAAPASDGRAAAPSTTGATPGSQAASAAAGGITTLPDGRASTPVGRTAEDSGRTLAADRTTAYNDRAADVRVADVRAAETRTTDNRATSNVRTTDGRVAATATNSRSTSDGRTSSGSRRSAPGGRNDAPGMAQDKIDALAAQSARTMPTDKAASLERDRQARSRVNHIGPGWWD